MVEEGLTLASNVAEEAEALELKAQILFQTRQFIVSHHFFT